MKTIKIGRAAGLRPREKTSSSTSVHVEGKANPIGPYGVMFQGVWG